MASFNHLTLDDRILIASMLDKNVSFKQIGLAVGKHCTTVSREVRNRLVFEKTGAYGRPYNACKNRFSCGVSKLCPDCPNKQRGRKCSMCPSCNGMCKDFEKEACPKLSKPPYVCNGCHDRTKCTLEKCFYKARQADSDYRAVLSETRQGISLEKEEVSRLDRIISPLIKNGQSVHHICVSNKDKVMVSESTVYRLIGYGLFSARNIDLARRVRFASRKRVKAAKVDRKCREGRTYGDFQSFRKENPGQPVTEADSVEGKKGGKCLLTIHFVKAEFMLAFLRDANDSFSAIQAFDELFLKLSDDAPMVMPVVLADNGSEFSNPSRIEKGMDVSVRTRMFYCDPSAPHQKGSAERNHELIRYFIPKGTDMGFLTQEMVNHMMDNINSLKRKSLGDKCPYDMFEFLYGKDVLDRLGCRKIPANDVVLTPKAFESFAGPTAEVG